MPLPSQTAVVLLPSSHASRILELAQQWTASWLLTPAAYVDLSEVRASTTDEPLNIPCHVIGHDAAVALDLFRALSRFGADVLRMVAVRVVARDGPDATDEGQQLTAIRDAVERSRPRSRRLVAVNLLVAPTGRGGVADYRGLVLPDWVNVIASPEDRESLDGFDRFTRESDPDRFIGFALSHTAAAGGLWAGSPAGPYDDHVDTSPGVIMQRATLRGVFADGMLADVASAAAERLIDSQLFSDQILAARVEGLKPLPPKAVEGVTQRLVENSLAFDDGALTYTPVQEPNAVAKRRLEMVNQMTEFSRFARDVLASIPVSIAQGLARRASRRVTDTLHSPEGEAEVVLERWMPQLSYEIGADARALEAQQALARARLDQPLPRTREDLNPRLWASMRRLSFAALDGSEPPESVEPLGETAPAVEVFGETNSLIPDWRDRWTPSRSGVEDAEARFDLHEHPALWNDDEALARWTTRLAAAIASRSKRAQNKEALASDLRREVHDLEVDLVRADDRATRLTDEAETLRAEFEDLNASARTPGDRTDAAEAMAADTTPGAGADEEVIVEDGVADTTPGAGADEEVIVEEDGAADLPPNAEGPAERSA